MISPDLEQRVADALKLTGFFATIGLASAAGRIIEWWGAAGMVAAVAITIPTMFVLSMALTLDV